MNNQTLLSIVNSVDLSPATLYDMVDICGLERAVEIEAKAQLYDVLDYTMHPITSGGKDEIRVVNNLYKLHKSYFINKAIEGFKKEYK